MVTTPAKAEMLKARINARESVETSIFMVVTPI
jgi:hypothetical protein